ncbi:hypothetical protein [Saccharopolyspora sp. NPDC002686]|uniref:hypothetical protein n=1 Tax=Saccharopolyspora sp. NPDC002686 TaxID=3154541 RepID=UPI00331B5BCD
MSEDVNHELVMHLPPPPEPGAKEDGWYQLAEEPVTGAILLGLVRGGEFIDYRYEDWTATCVLGSC